MEKYIETKGQQLLFNSGDRTYPYLLEITKFVENCSNPNNYNGVRQFRLLDKNFVATGDGYTLDYLSKYFPNCELIAGSF